MNMKSDFVLKFIKGVIKTGKEMRDIYNWEIRYARPALYRKNFSTVKEDQKKAYHGFKNLERRGIIKNVDDDRFKFTAEGRIWLRSSLLRYYKDLGIKWDKKWRVVIFDIPQELHNKRNRFRKRLKLLGFYRIQKSVFAFPYPCENELAEYCGDLNISEYVNIINADDLGDVSEEVKKVFNI